MFSLKTSLNASDNQLVDWNQNQVNPCTWSKVICDSGYNVTTVYVIYLPKKLCCYNCTFNVITYYMKNIF